MTASNLSRLLAQAERDPTNSGLHLLAAMDIVMSRDWGGETPTWRGVSWHFGELAEALIAHAIALEPANPGLYSMQDQIRAERQRRTLWGKLRALLHGKGTGKREHQQVDPFKKTFVCPVCGWPELANPPFREPLWSDQDDCPCCGFEMEVDSEIKGWSYENYRAQWILDGMPWWSPTSGPPRGLDKESQLASIGVDARSFAEEMIKDGFPVGSRLNEDGPDWHRHYVCPVCGFGGLWDPPVLAVALPSYTFCPCCKYAWATVEASTEENYATHRRQWIWDGCRFWLDGLGGPQPEPWSPADQLKSIGIDLQEFGDDPSSASESEAEG